MPDVLSNWGVGWTSAGVRPFLQFGQGLVVEGLADPHLEDMVSAGEAFVSWSELKAQHA